MTLLLEQEWRGLRSHTFDLATCYCVLFIFFTYACIRAATEKGVD